MTIIDEKVLIKISEAEEKYKIPNSTIYDKIKEGILTKFFDDDKTVLIDKAEFLKTFKPSVLTLYNKKGGVAKTTSSICLADYFEKRGVKVLVVDLDSQANATDTLIGYEKRRESQTLYNFFENNTPLSKIVQQYNDFIDILPSDDLISTKESLDTTRIAQYKETLYKFFRKYSIVIVDCPPAINAMSRLGLLLSNYVIIPVQSEPYAYDGMDFLLDNLESVVKFNTDYIDYRVFVSMHRGVRSVIREDMYEALKDELKNKLLKHRMLDFVGFVERSRDSRNLFEKYPDEKPVNEMNCLFEEIYKFVFF